ncbi:SUMO-activating enzyme subunit 1B-2 [Abeliophyllum distichum]|uniref:Ubiquitin-like 1-activating enzyme E1A n=1 Tax=Abeliophyllum distichum TaxID=126358 RepID=A0ABD1VSQ5_9LAMI
MLRNLKEDGNRHNLGLKMLLYNTHEEISGKKHLVPWNSHLIPKFLRLKIDDEELTEQETAVYDRQIRVWGVDAQRRLSKSHILVSGIKGTIVEFCKNIVLAGVGSLTVHDDRMVTEELLSANFLIPPDENVYSGKSIAELCCDSLKDFNPMVRVSVQKGDLLSFDVDFFGKFDVVIVSSCSLSTKVSVNEKCRRLSKQIAFYTVDCRGSCGEIFVDLQNYIYSKGKADEKVECLLEYLSFEEAISIPWRSLPRGLSKLYLVLRVIEQFEEIQGRTPGEISTADFLNVQKLRKELCQIHFMNESEIPDSFLQRLLAGGARESSPVCAIIGGILGQEVIKAISGKGDPLKNFFLFDAMDGKGIIQDISKVQAPKTEFGLGSVERVENIV